MSTNQRNATAGHNIIGGDNSEVHHHYASHPKHSKIEKLKSKLQQEVENGLCSSGTIEKLLLFKKPVPSDGIQGLEAKLEISGRSERLIIALEMKEQFAKLLERWSLYASAQEIFVHLLAMAEYKYSHQVLPYLGSMPPAKFDELIEEKIILPAIEETGIEVFTMDHQTAMGMVYWLAEQCRIRWHQ